MTYSVMPVNNSLTHLVQTGGEPVKVVASAVMLFSSCSYRLATQVTAANTISGEAVTCARHDVQSVRDQAEFGRMRMGVCRERTLRIWSVLRVNYKAVHTG